MLEEARAAPAVAVTGTVCVHKVSGHMENMARMHKHLDSNRVGPVSQEIIF